MSLSPYQELVNAGCEIDNHESDLQVKWSPEAERIVKESGWANEVFTSNIDGSKWIEVIYAYNPWWEARGMLVKPVKDPKPGLNAKYKVGPIDTK